MSSSRGKLIKIGRRLLGICLAGAFVFFFYRAVAESVTRVSGFKIFPGIAGLSLTLGGFIVWILVLELASEWVLRRCCAHDPRVSWRRTCLAFYQSFLLRYVPGKIWAVGGRTESLAGHIPRPDVLRSILYEQLHYAAATVIFALMMSPFFFYGSIGGIHPGALLGILGVGTAGVAIWLFWPRQLFAMINRVMHVLPKWKGQAFILRGHERHWRIAFVIYMLVVGLQAAVLFPLVASLLPASMDLTLAQWIVVLGTYPISRLIGQMSIVAPGGLGVREGAYVLLMLPIMDSSVSSMIVVWARLLSVIPELLMFMIFWMLCLRDKEAVIGDPNGERDDEIRSNRQEGNHLDRA